MKDRKKQQRFARVRADTQQHSRILLVAAVLGLLAFVPIGIRLYTLMVTDYEYYADKALKNQSRSTAVSPERGMIFDRNMNVLACNESVETVYLDPREIRQFKEDLDEIAGTLASILDLDSEWIVAQGKDMTKRYKQVAAGVDAQKAAAIRQFIVQEDIRGIHLEPNRKRVYPYGTLAAQVIGFTNASNNGSEGIEAAYDSFLSGAPGTVVATKGNYETDMPFAYERYLASNPGCSAILTLDATVQTCLEKQMQNAIDRYDVQNGAFGIVMNVNTGEILAMATLGNYDPNAYLQIRDEDIAAELEQQRLSYMANPEGSAAYTQGEQAYRQALTAARLKQWRNRCICDGYEPGSTFKVLTMAAALDCGAIDLNTDFYCAGAEQIPGRAQRLHCWRSTGHGGQKTPQALQNSCNLAFAHIALKLGGEQFYSYVQNFGVLEKTGVDLIGESKGVFFDKALVTDTEKWGTASLTSGSFGQTFKLTPLQLVRAISAVVNGGVLMEPYMVSEIVDGQGNTVLMQEPTQVRRVISSATSETMCRLLESVVTEGTAKNAGISGFSVGGKTGTSEKIDVFDENGQRVQDKIVSFVGIAPMEDPEYIVLVALDTPSRKTGIYISGGVMAAPTVGAVLADILPYLGVEQNYTPEDAAGRLVVLPDMTDLPVEEAQKLLKEKNLTYRLCGEGERITGQIPSAGSAVPGNSEVILYLETMPQIPAVRVPDLMGMNRQQASDAAGELGLYILAKGNPELSATVTVAAQVPAAGTQVPAGTVLELEFIDSKASD